MDRLKQFLEDCGILLYLNGREEGAPPVYLVGGALRDSIKGIIVSDFDFIMPADPTACAKGLAHIYKGTWFMLDSSRNQSRVVMNVGGQRVVCDFAPFRAPTLDGDLLDRDFTINALAWPCGSPSVSGYIHDPLGGIADLERNRLRVCSERSFQEDPLRTLKAIRHATCMHLSIDSETFSLLKDAVSSIDQIAPERIRAELSKILDDDDVTSGIRLLNDSGLLQEIFGRPASQESVLHAIEHLELLEQLIVNAQSSKSSSLRPLLTNEFEEYLTFASALKFSVFCRAYRPIALKNVLKALKFSNRTINFVLEMQSFELADSLSALKNLPAVSRAQARWVSKLGREPIGVLYVMMTEMLALQMDLSPIELLADSFNTHAEDGKLSDLVDGNWLRTNYQINAGPMVGRLLKLIEDAELKGEVSTAQDARKWLWNNQKTIDNILLEKL